MFRKLSLTLAVSAVLSPIGVYALGLGDIDTKSALNESFKANIQLLSVAPGEIDGIRAELASPSDFAKAGLERPFLLSKLRFNPVELDDGKYVIRVSTRGPVREPFLNFLVEVNWPKGRLLREFTVLLDPPVTTGRKPPPIQVAAVPVRELMPSPPPIVPAPVHRPPPAQVSAGDYGPVPRGATLWGIARDMAVPGATTEQVLMALYRANPHAFAKNDINNLLAGVALRLPGREEILSTSPRQARSEFRGQTVHGSDATVRPPRRTVHPDQLQIATAPAEPTTQPSEGEGVAVRGGDFEQVKTDLMMVRETSESTRQETEDLRSRIRELESQLGDIRQLLKLKSNQLAQLQGDPQPLGSMAEDALDSEIGEEEAFAPPVEPIRIEEAPAVPVEPVIEQAGAETELASPMEPQLEDVETGDTPREPEQEQEPVIEPEPTVQETVEVQEITAPVPFEPPVAETITPAEPPVVQEQPRPAPKPSLPPLAKAEPVGLGSMDDLLEDPTMLAAGGGGAIVLLGLVWWLMRRRRVVESEYQEDVLSTPIESSTIELEEEGERETASRPESGEETSFISDFSPSDIDALQEETGEVDPAAEADVYIAYGRYQQAESLISQALEKAPGRLDLKMKLLEIYFTTRNVSAFTGMAKQMRDDGVEQGDPQLWARVQSMGRELAPGHDMFGGESELDDLPIAADSEVSLVNDGELASDSEDLANLDLDLDLDTEMSELSDSSEGGVSDFLGSDMGSMLEPPPPPIGHDASEPSPLADSLSDSAAVGKEDSDFTLDLDTLDDMNLGDLDLDLDDVSTHKDEAKAVETKEPELSLQLPEEALYPVADFAQEEEDVPVISMDELESVEIQDVSESEVLFEGDEEAPLVDMLGVGGRDEEIDTKLDLAKAYAEMGDAEGAREILDEVLEEGSDKQKSQAGELKAKLV